MVKLSLEMMEDAADFTIYLFRADTDKPKVNLMAATPVNQFRTASTVVRDAVNDAVGEASIPFQT